MPKKNTAKLSEADLDAQSIPARRPVREILIAAGKRKLNLAALHGQLISRPEFAGLSMQVTEHALEWNFKKGHATFTHDSDLEADLWEITPRGRNET